ncbi:MAG: CynX/NimT family MFS transporter [Acidimicrobiia bacterium]
MTATRRWTLFAAAWLVYAGFGLTSGAMAPVVGEIRHDLGLSTSAMGLVLGAWQLVYLFSAIPGGRVIDRLGARRAVAATAVLVAASAAARAGAQGFVTLYLAVALFGLGGPLISIGGPKLIAAWFAPEDRGKAVGLYSTAPAVGAMVALFAMHSVAIPLTGSWRGAMLLYAGGTLSTGLVWWVLSRSTAANNITSDTATGTESVRHGRGALAEQAPTRTSRQLLGTRSVQLVLVLAVGSFLYNHGIGNWLVEMLRDGGRSASGASSLGALTTLVGIASALVVPRLATPARRRPLYLSVYLIGAVGVALVPHLGGGVVFVALVAVGVTRAAALPLGMMLLMDDPDVGAENMAVAGGLYFTAGEIGGVVGPLLVGSAAQSAGGYGLAALLLGGCALAMAVVVGRMPAARRLVVAPSV